MSLPEYGVRQDAGTEKFFHERMSILSVHPLGFPPGSSLHFVYPSCCALLLQYGVRQAAETENFFTSVERISAYTVVEDEEERAPSQTAPVIPDKSWPQVRPFC